VEDVLYLTTESGQSKITQAPITFGYVYVLHDLLHS
jgi:hypothetical protein